jgi:hypothetical protein
MFKRTSTQVFHGVELTSCCALGMEEGERIGRPQDNCSS